MTCMISLVNLKPSIHINITISIFSEFPLFSEWAGAFHEFKLLYHITGKLQHILHQFPHSSSCLNTHNLIVWIEQDFLGATGIWSHITEEVLYAFCGKQLSLCPNGSLFVWSWCLPSTWYVCKCQMMLIFGICRQTVQSFITSYHISWINIESFLS